MAQPLRTVNHSAPPSAPGAHVSPLESHLPALLSAVAGMVDVISFLHIKLFTAHVTGNLVVIAALLVHGGPPNLAQVMAVPVFMLAVAGVWLIAKKTGKRGPDLARLLLMVQFLLLACVLLLALAFHPAANPRGLIAVITAMIAVSAMACQFALLRLAVPGAPSTAVMTGNLTKTVLSLLDTLSPTEPLLQGPRMQLRKTLELVLGFFAGCLVGAGAALYLGEWAWAFPVALAGVVAALSRTWQNTVAHERAVGI